MSKRYVLVKADGEGPKPCAFFASAAGCRNAAGCKFLHGDLPTSGSLSAGTATKTKPAAPATAHAVTPTPPPVSMAVATPSAVNGLLPAKGEAERAAKKKAKKKAKKEKEAARQAAAAAAAATAAAPAPAPAQEATPTPTPPPPSAVAAASFPPVTAVTAEQPAAPAEAAAAAAVVAEQALSKTKAKKQAFREKAARKAEAAAALAASNAVAANAAATATAAAAAATPTAVLPSATPPAVVVPAASAAPGPAAVAPAAAALPVSKKKKRKNKKKAAAAATAAGVAAGAPVPTPAAPAPAVAPAPAAAVAGPPPPVFHPMPPMSSPAPAAKKPAKPTVRVCSFFNKKKGCQVGALCPFLHQGIEGGGFGGTRGRAQPPAPAAAAVVVAAAPAVVPPRAPPVAVVAAAVTASPKTKRAKPTVVSSPATAPAVALAAGAPAAATAATLPVLPVATPPPPPPQPSAAMQTTVTVAEGGVARESPSRRTRKRGRSETLAAPAAADAAAAADGAGLFDGLPISPFVTLGTTPAAAASKESAVAPAAVPPGIPHPKADVWQGLVERTRAHPKYPNSYSFQTDATWITASPCGEACAGLPQVLALDCEMCMSEDPLSKERNGKELLRLSIVRGEDGEKMIDTLVRPSNPVVDWRTDIHGVGPEHLEGVMFTQRHAQVAISRICCQHTVIIGHALNNDLKALKMAHDKVVDTSFLFEGMDKKFSTPSLKDVVKVSLGRDIQEGSHDSVTDAKSTLEAAMYALENTGAPLPAIPRSAKRSRDRQWEGSPGSHHDKKKRGLGDEDGADAIAAKIEKEERSLMVHRLPTGTTQGQLLKVMQKKTKVVALEAGDIEFTGATGKAHVVYPTRAQADIAFNGIPTKAQEDSSGRLQKKIYTSTDNKKFIAVRHAVVMTDDAEEEQGQGLPDVSSSSSSEED